MGVIFFEYLLMGFVVVVVVMGNFCFIVLDGKFVWLGMLGIFIFFWLLYCVFFFWDEVFVSDDMLLFVFRFFGGRFWLGGVFDRGFLEFIELDWGGGILLLFSILVVIFDDDVILLFELDEKLEFRCIFCFLDGGMFCCEGIFLLVDDIDEGDLNEFNGGLFDWELLFFCKGGRELWVELEFVILGVLLEFGILELGFIELGIGEWEFVIFVGNFGWGFFCLYIICEGGMFERLFGRCWFAVVIKVVWVVVLVFFEVEVFDFGVLGVGGRGLLVMLLILVL